MALRGGTELALTVKHAGRHQRRLISHLRSSIKKSGKLGGETTTRKSTATTETQSTSRSRSCWRNRRQTQVTSFHPRRVQRLGFLHSQATQDMREGRTQPGITTIIPEEKTLFTVLQPLTTSLKLFRPIGRLQLKNPPL